jgi:PPK2 family polyphosphate:nucleotide phosphotransferase
MEKYRINPHQKIKIDDWKTVEDDLEFDKVAAKEKLSGLCLELASFQEVLYAQHKHKILVVLQGMDTSGKDGTIRNVFEGVNPQGMQVASFKVPTPGELDHDYLWRIHKRTPGKGEIVIFNRSHYEDVLVVRVHELVSTKVWKKRYEQINQFERLLSDEGTTILKFYLHISKEEQKQRLQARLDDPTKQWKFRLDDIEERQRWSDYQRAYEDVLSRTSTDWAPWYIIPSDQKWYRNLVIGTILVEKIKSLKLEYPPAEENLEGVVIN